jgi:hypothetical protein
MSLFVYLAIFGALAGTIGRLKGSSFFAWFLIGFCLPLIGVLAAVLYRNERDEPRRSCPECNKVLPVHVQVCPRCGRDLEFPDETYVSENVERALRTGGANGGGE